MRGHIPWCVTGKSKRLRPGDRALQSGQYRNTKTGAEVTVVAGEPFPPSPVKGAAYVLVDLTRHKRKATRKPRRKS